MNIAICQTSVIWENTKENLNNYNFVIRSLFKEYPRIDLAIFPEFFSTGFSINRSLVESVDGVSTLWLRKISKEYNTAVMASIPILDDGKYYNRALFITPDTEFRYDKRHLFSYGGENKLFSQGEAKSVINYKGWNILLQICYDLRFPVWSRNIGMEYDLAINVANWPSSREGVVNPLVRARAIENLCYYAFINRDGHDPLNRYNPIGMISDFKGSEMSPLYTTLDGVCTVYCLDIDILRKFRETFRPWEDADKFVVK